MARVLYTFFNKLPIFIWQLEFDLMLSMLGFYNYAGCFDLNRVSDYKTIGRLQF